MQPAFFISVQAIISPQQSSREIQRTLYCPDCWGKDMPELFKIDPGGLYSGSGVIKRREGLFQARMC